MMTNPETCSDGLCVDAFIKARLIEADGKTIQFAFCCSRKSGHDARVQATANEQSDRYVGHESTSDTEIQKFSQLFDAVVFAPICWLMLLERNVPVTRDEAVIIAVNQIVTGLQLFDRTEDCVGSGNIFIAEIFAERSKIHISAYGGMV